MLMWYPIHLRYRIWVRDIIASRFLVVEIFLALLSNHIYWATNLTATIDLEFQGIWTQNTMKFKDSNLSKLLKFNVK
jgi:hypothetical protein